MPSSEEQRNQFGDGTVLNRALDILAADVLQARCDARKPVNRTNKQRFLEVAACKEQLMAFTKLNMQTMGIQHVNG